MTWAQLACGHWRRVKPGRGTPRIMQCRHPLCDYFLEHAEVVALGDGPRRERRTGGVEQTE